MCVLCPVDASDSQSEFEDGAGGGSHDPLAALREKLKGLSAAYDLIVKNSQQLLKFANEWEESGAISDVKPKEKFALFKITAAAMVKVRVIIL